MTLTDDPRTEGGADGRPPRRGLRARLSRPGETDGLVGILVKIVLLALVDAFALYAVFLLAAQEEWFLLAVTVVLAVAVNVIYLRRDGLPAKYLAPGIVLLLVFQVFVMAYTGFIAFTNAGDGHLGSKDDAVAAISAKGQERVPDSPQYQLTVLERRGELAFLLTAPDGTVTVGSSDAPQEEAGDAETDGSGKAVGLDGYTPLSFEELLQRQDEILDVAVPVSDDPADGSLRTSDGSSAYEYRSNLRYDAADDTVTDTTTGVVYRDDGDGAFVAPDGDALVPGWQINVGLDNFRRAVETPQLRDSLVSVIAWTFAFATLSVVLCFGLGLFLATVFNVTRMRGKKVYRVMLILPYAFPAFLSGLVWSGLLNAEFGFINQVFFGGAEIEWLTDPWLARFSVLFVNLWLGFPYMFLVCTGALQSIPDEMSEAARMDGAGPWKAFRAVKLPLLLVSVAPLLITTFAFNFNNFNVIYMLTGGGPRFEDTANDVGATDLLITMVYKVAFGTGTGRDYGLASALAIIIFVVIGIISAMLFRRTKTLEDIH
ncbi:ABC transporter permease subunit [Mumia zhuanghuii]|uniref:Maltose/maltodextrin transport system permease protein n=1 Tax=Mumia zhuanghuii TaxID=2585211 RepID=A0A5C4MK48_9ACTN|nr:ABC transporter permease subunit [Mumia zhuanghuii]TNC46099.1 ABC transporter permease subunit [Mumia zhuanghuii]TNC48876.1 ABC transporter permease subunit [Mumia zhuanghuii]